MNRPVFRQVTGPLDVNDEELARIDQALGVPELVKSPAATPAIAKNLREEASNPEPSPSPTRRTPTAKKSALASRPVLPTVKLSVEVPGYVSDALNVKAAQERSTVRHIVMQSLSDSGIDIDPADLVPDGRRAGKSRR